MTARLWLRILLYQDLPGIWVARSLEHDIAVEGRTVEAAVDQILQIVFAHVEFDQRHGRTPLSAFPGAPQRYWNTFAGAAPFRTVAGCRNAQSSFADSEILIAVTHERPLAVSYRLSLGAHAPLPSRTQATVSVTSQRIN